MSDDERGPEGEGPYEPEELDDEFFDNLVPKDGGGGGKERGKKRKVKLNFDEAETTYANFCTLSGRRDEVYLCFGQAFPPVKDLKVETRVVMSRKNAAQLHGALTKLLKKQGGNEGGE